MEKEKQRITKGDKEKWNYDFHLVQLSLQGDYGAWEILYHEALPAVWEAVRSCNWENVLSAEDMEEIVQDAFSRSYVRRADFEKKSQFKTWVCGFVKKISLEYKRKKYSQLEKQRIYSYALMPSFPDPELSCILKESDFCLWLSFDSLSKRHRLLLSCYVLEWEDIKTVRQYLKTSYNKMREELEMAVGLLRGRYLSLYYGEWKGDADDGVVRYMVEDCDTAYIDPTLSSAFSGSFRQLQIYPRVTNGEAYESFVTLYENITVHIPADADVRCYAVYDDRKGTAKNIAIDTDNFPGCYDVPDKQMWAFPLQDASLYVQPGDKAPLQLEINGRYCLKLSCIGVGRIRGYLTGKLMFQNTSTPKNYELMGQLVDIASKNNALNVVLSMDSRSEPQIEKELLVSGEATQLDIAGVDPFPNMQMWFRENVYMAPVSLLSVIISMYGLSQDRGRRKVRPRKIGKRKLDCLRLYGQHKKPM